MKRILIGIFFLATAVFGQNLSSNNGVNVIGSLPAGSNVIGGVTQSGTWNVTVNAALPAGSNSIGTVVLGAGAATIGSLAANQSVNVSQINGVTPLMGAGNGGTGSLRVNIASDQVTIPVSLNNSTCVGTQKSKAWIAVPTSATSVTTTTACVTAITFTNTNSSTQTVTVVDGQGSPITMVATWVIPANSTVTFPFYGEPATSGFKWSAGGSGVTGAASWVE